MSGKIDFESLLRGAHGLVGTTGVPYYDETYCILLSAGTAVRSAYARGVSPDRAQIAVIALGLAGWTHGSALGPELSKFLANDRARTKLLHTLEMVERALQSPSLSKQSQKRLEKWLTVAVERARRVLELIKSGTTASLASKLLHFLSPQHFCIYDSRAAEGFRKEADKTRASPKRLPHAAISTYKRLQLALWQLKLQEATVPPGDRELAKYWQCASDQGVTPMRVVDCTFYVKGKG